jgi:hypothetical protein
VSDFASGNGHRDLPLPPRGTGRRRSLIILAVLVVGLPLAFLLRAATDQGWRRITSVDVLEARQVIYLPEPRIFLVHGTPPFALSAVSPHLGEPIAWCPSANDFEEMAHGSKWNRLGYYMDGPAPRGMDRVAVRVRNRYVEINAAMVAPGDPRGSGPQLRPTGPYCHFEVPADARDGFVHPSPLVSRPYDRAEP